MPSKTVLFALAFGALALILLPVTSLWALFAYLSGDKFPLYAINGKNLDDPIDNP